MKGSTYDHIEPEPARLGRHRAADAAVADEAQNLASQAGRRLDGSRVIPGARVDRGEHLLQAAGVIEQQGDGVGRYLVDGIIGHGGDPDALCRRRGNVDGIQAGADPRDDFAIRKRADERGINRLDGDHQGVGFARCFKSAWRFEVSRLQHGRVNGAEGVVFQIGYDIRLMRDDDGFQDDSLPR